MRVIVAGGGTGGHVIPALAIAHELRARHGAEVAFVGTRRGIECRLVPNAGYTLHLVEVGALKNVSIATRLKTLFDLPRSVFRAMSILSQTRADVVIGVGGYASGPAMMAAALLGVRSIAFEPNVVPGFANRVVATAVSAAAVQFEETCRFFRRCYVTGVPVRHAFFEVPPRATDAPPTLLVFGGSQGARAINAATAGALAELNRLVPGIHVIHQTGEKDYHEITAAYLGSGISAEVYPFIDNMPEAFARADLLVCRSGASTCAEITAAGKAAIFVPFPRAADDHQLRNAEALVRKGAALLLPEKELTSTSLAESAAALFRDAPRRHAMENAAKTLAHPHAARDVAALAARVAT